MYDPIPTIGNTRKNRNHPECLFLSPFDLITITSAIQRFATVRKLAPIGERERLIRELDSLERYRDRKFSEIMVKVRSGEYEPELY